MRPAWLGGLLVLVLCSCGRSSDGPGWEATVDTLPSGTRVAEHFPSSSVSADWVLREDLRVGTVDGEGAASFGGLRGLAVMDDGRFAVLDAIAQEVRVFGPTGEHLATHGGKGGGPGELEAAFGLMRHPNGTLWVPDHRNARMSVFDADLGFQSSYPLTLLSRGFIWRGAMTATGHVWKPSISLDPPRPNVMRIYGPEMSLLDMLPLPPDPDIDPEDPPGAFFWQSSDGNSRAYFGVPYFPRGDQLIDPSGAVWSMAYGDPSYRIARWEPGADTTLILAVHRAPVAIPAVERDSAIAMLRDQLSGRGVANQDWSKVPSVRPAVTTIFVSDVGNLWVLAEVEGGQVFDVFTRSGEHLRTVRNSLNLYRSLRPVVRRSYLWAVVTDDLDVQYVVRASIEPAAQN